MSLLLAGDAAAAEDAAPPPRLLYHPSIHGDVIAFSCFGDIWTVRLDGSGLKRITDHPGRDVHPVFSPDGKWIAFGSTRTGPYNVFVVPSPGGEARQFTWSSAHEMPVTWTPDGTKIVLQGPPNGTWQPWLYTVSIEGGMREPFRIGEALFGTFSSDGTRFAFNRKGIGAPWRKGYIGSGDSDVWVADLEAGTFERLTDFEGPDSWPLFAPNGDIFFVSERDGADDGGVKNLYRLPRGRKTPVQLTDHERPGVVHPAISPDGRTLVYQHNFAIWTVPARGGKATQVPISITGEPKRKLREWVTFGSRCEEYAVRPDGKRVAVSCRGELFTVPTGKAGTKVRVTEDAGRDRVPVYSPDGTKLAFVSDRAGESNASRDEHIYIYDRATKALTEIVPPEPLMAIHVWTWGTNRMTFRPDGKALAFQAGHGLYVYDLESGETTTIVEGAERAVGSTAWSPDGRWLAYSKPDLELVEHLFVYSFETGEARQIFDDPAGEWNPTFTPNGKYLLFIGSRELDSGDMYDRDGRSWVRPEVYALSLQKEESDPDEPKDPDEKKPEVEETKDKDEDEDDDKGGTDKAVAPEDDGDGDGAAEETADEAADDAVDDEAEAEEKKDEVRVEIDFENVDQRVRRLTSMAESVWSRPLVTPDSERVIFGVEEWRGKNRVSVIYSAKIERTGDAAEDLKEIATLGFWSMQLAEEGKTIFVHDGGQVKKVPAGGGKVETVEFNLRYAIDVRAEVEQMYYDAWRAMRDGFYDPEMHGVDWAAVRDKYAPFLGSVVDKQEVMDLIIEIIGELNASHCGAWTGRRDGSWPYEDSRRIGLELEADAESGLYRIARILDKGPADKSWLDLQVGDYVFEIEGHAVHAGDEYEQFLVNPLNDKVTLLVGREADPEQGREVRLGHLWIWEERQFWYDAWVKANERHVEEQTDGRVGYLHIQGMNGRALAKFKKDLLRLRNYEGLIIDVRHNGGGLIDDVLLDILNRRPYNITRMRGASLRRKRPEEAFYGVKAVLIDSFSFSDAEMFPDGFRTLGHGKLIGEPTHGGVIGTGAYELVDGSTIRMPIWGIWSITGQNLENYGVPPDILVEHNPMENLNGTDSQLDAAIKEVVSELGDNTQ